MIPHEEPKLHIHTVDDVEYYITIRSFKLRPSSMWRWSCNFHFKPVFVMEMENDKIISFMYDEACGYGFLEEDYNKAVLKRTEEITRYIEENHDRIRRSLLGELVQ